MRVDSANNQIPEKHDLVSVSAGPATCDCGKWRLVKVGGRGVCAGCGDPGPACQCVNLEAMKRKGVK